MHTEAHAHARIRTEYEYRDAVRLKIIGDEMIQNVGKYQSCMVSKVPILFKRTRMSIGIDGGAKRKRSETIRF